MSMKPSPVHLEENYLSIGTIASSFGRNVGPLGQEN
jgi:hypothetical protein